ncbi:MAG: hypothetical protein AB7U45_06320 [Desulfamplus sp.]
MTHLIRISVIVFILMIISASYAEDISSSLTNDQDKRTLIERIEYLEKKIEALENRLDGKSYIEDVKLKFHGGIGGYENIGYWDVDGPDVVDINRDSYGNSGHSGLHLNVIRKRF